MPSSDHKRSAPPATPVSAETAPSPPDSTSESPAAFVSEPPESEAVPSSKWAAGGPENDDDTAGRGQNKGKSRRKKKKKGRWRRRLLIATGAMPVAILALWIATHHIPWLGPLLADGLRAVIGAEAVTDLEEFAYGLQDRWNRYWKDGDQPKAYWEVPANTAETPASEPPEPPEATDSPRPCLIVPFKPEQVGPVHQSWSAPGDGVWVAINDPQHPADRPRMFKTLLHPDRKRSWAAVSVVAIDLRQVDLHMVAGRHEPRNGTREAYQYKRSAIIPKHLHGELLAAFNGGFKAVHGHYGMKIDGVTILKPRRLSCLIAKYPDERLAIGDWEKLKDTADSAAWWRQTPGCMVEHNKLHPGLRAEKNTYWGATLDGDTIIRRSALGLSANGKVLYMGIGDFTSAKAMALGMKHAGAFHVAQLDVNWSYPKFVLYKPRLLGSPELIATPLTEGFKFAEDEYIGSPHPRDFFYLIRKSRQRIEAKLCGPPGATAEAPQLPARDDGDASEAQVLAQAQGG